MEKRKWIAIVNPNARGGEVGKKWEKVEQELKNKSIHFEASFTEYKGHAIDLVSSHIENGERNFLVIGGDGTINEVVNSAFAQTKVLTNEILIGLIPFGSGNDWSRMYNIPSSYEEAIDILEDGKIFTQDVGKVTYNEGSKTFIRYFINMAGMGFDARVAQRTNKSKDKGNSGGAFIYFKNLILTLLLHRNTFTEVMIDDGKASFKTKTFSLTVGIGNFNGGGMMQLPYARPYDGLLDLTLIGRITKFEVIKQIKNLYDGSFVHHPKVHTFKGKNIKIGSKPRISIEVDGESLGHSPFEFEIIPQSIKILGVKLCKTIEE